MEGFAGGDDSADDGPGKGPSPAAWEAAQRADGPGPSPPPLPSYTQDVTVLVGSKRTPFCVSAGLLRKAGYFRAAIQEKLRQHRQAAEEAAESSTDVPAPKNAQMTFIWECDESLFAQILWLLRYESFTALPKMTDDELFRLRREMEFLGILIYDAPWRDVDEGVSGAPLGLLNLPSKLADPSRLVRVVRLGKDGPPIRCQCQGGGPTWIVSVFYGHAFCDTCGSPPSISQKLLADMFLTASGVQTASWIEPVAGWELLSLTTVPDQGLRLRRLDGIQGCFCVYCHASSWGVVLECSHAFCRVCLKMPSEPALVAKIFLATHSCTILEPQPSEE
eukprot:SM000202S05870  [mRNA]  locus=s202:26442:28519:- [translate_table: standard]